MLKLNAYDRKILGILLVNSREQISKISKKVRLRRENVNYRINRLVRLGLINGFNTIFSDKALGLTRYSFFVQLTNLKEDTEKDIFAYFKESDYIAWSGTAAGKWSLITDIVLPSSVELNEAIKEFLIKFGDFIDEYTILKIEDGEYLDYKLLELPKPTKSFENKRAELDEKDKKILSILNEDSKANCVGLSGKIKLTPNGINNRIKSLEKQRVIQRYTISLNYKMLGYEWYGIQLKLSKYDRDTEKKLKSYLTHHKSIIVFYQYIGGSWDYDLGLIVKSSIELRDFIHGFRKEFPNIKIYDVFLVLDETSNYKLPKGVFR